jgi:hypothetical protein
VGGVRNKRTKIMKARKNQRFIEIYFNRHLTIELKDTQRSKKTQKLEKTPMNRSTQTEKC